MKRWPEEFDTARAARTLGVIITLAGVLEVTGWVLGIPLLKSVSPGFATMKFSTAVSFFLGGITIYFIAETAEGRTEAAQAVLPLAVMVILLFMITMAASSFMGIRTGVEDLFIREEEAPIETTVPGRPSLMTMFDFILIAACGILAMFNPKSLGCWVFFAGLFVASTGFAAVVGYALEEPFLYFSIEGFSTAMALNTAVLFILCGAALMLVRKSKDRL